MVATEEDQMRDLLRLQDLDTVIRRVRHHLEHLEEQQRLDETRAKLSAIEVDEGRVARELDTIGAEQRRLEGDVDLLRQRRDAEQARMYSGDIHNARELQSLRAEIDSVERRITEHEDELLASMERGEELETRRDQLTARSMELSTRLDELTTARDEAAKEALAELAEHEVARERLREQLDDALLARYDAATAKFHGVAVGALENGMCTACRIELPVAEASRMLDGPPLATCPQCSRLLVVV